MKQEFVTTTGLVIIEKDKLFIRRKVYGRNWKTIIEGLAPIFFLLLCIFKVMEDDSPMRNFGIFIYATIALISSGPLFNIIFRRSFSNRIPLLRILSFKMEDDHNGLETHLILRLSSGRERIISFRKLENQLPAFVSALESYGGSIQIA